MAIFLGGFGLTVSAKRHYGVDFNGELMPGAGISLCGDAAAEPRRNLSAGDRDPVPLELSCDQESEIKVCRSGTHDCECQKSYFEECLASGLCLQPAMSDRILH